MQTFLKNGYIVSMDQNDTVFDGGGVLVENDRITAVSYTHLRAHETKANMFCPDL